MVGALSCGVAWAAKPVAKPAQPAQSQQPSQQFVDGIAAVVNKHVITLQQVNTQAQLAQDQLRRQNIPVPELGRSEEHTSELQSLMRISYAVFCLKKKTK